MEYLTLEQSLIEHINRIAEEYQYLQVLAPEDKENKIICERKIREECSIVNDILETLCKGLSFVLVEGLEKDLFDDTFEDLECRYKRLCDDLEELKERLEYGCI